MNCARCGSHIPEESNSCPGCGLKLRAAPPPPVPLAKPPSPVQQDQRQDLPAQPAQPLPPGAYLAPGEIPLPGQYPSYGQAIGTKPPTKQKLPVAMIALIVAGILVIGVSAAVYFLVLKKTSPLTGPENVVIEYFDTLSSGRIESVNTLFAPDCQIPQDTLDKIAKKASESGENFKYENLVLETLTETATTATVHLKDMTISRNFDGKTETHKLSTVLLGDAKLVIGLKNVNGRWLLSGVPGGSLPIKPGP